MIPIGFLNIILLQVNSFEEQQKGNLQFFFLNLESSPRKSPRKSRKANNSDVDGASGTGAASSENDE